MERDAYASTFKNVTNRPCIFSTIFGTNYQFLFPHMIVPHDTWSWAAKSQYCQKCTWDNYASTGSEAVTSRRMMKKE